MIKEFFEKILNRTKYFFSGNLLVSGMDLPTASTKDYLESFRASSLVHSCTKKIGEKMSTIEYELYSLRGLNAKEIEQHEILDLLAKPNSLMTGSQLVEITSIYLTLLGDCYWYKARSKNKQIIELWLMRPDLTSIVQAKDGSVAGYKFRNGANAIIYPTEDVIHFKEPDPLSDYYGYSAVKSAMEVIRADVYAKKWNTRFFYNSARPDAILTTKQEIGKEDRDEIRQKWTMKYGGWENAQKVAVLSHGLEYKQVSVTQKDMDFANMRIANRDDVLMSLGVPKSIVSVTDDVSRANADAGIYVFLSETIKPKMEKMVDILNQFLITDFGEDLLLLSIDPTPEDNTALDDHYVKAYNKWLTVNEIRIEQGYDPIDGGDILYMSANNKDGEEKSIIEIGGDVKAKDYYNKKKEKRLREIYKRAMRGRKLFRLKENMVDKITISISQEIDKIIKNKNNENEKDIVWKIFDERLQKWDKKFRSLMDSLFRSQEKKAIKELEKIKPNKKAKGNDLGLLDFKKEVNIFIKKATPVIKSIVAEAGNLALQEVGKKIKKDFDINDPMTAEWIDKKAMKFGEEVNETTIKKLKATLAEGVLKGESIAQLKKRVEDLFEMWYTGRDKTIARTEVLSSNNAGSLFGYEQSGVVEYKEWLATRDARVRDSHKYLDGEKVLLNKKFSNGLEYPGDPNGSPEEIINCRCTLIPIIK